MKITIIGPIYPYKGGIAHYTSLFAESYQSVADVEVISFKYQYPSFIYPGDNQKDFDNKSFAFENTKFILHSLNPLNWLRLRKYIVKSGTQKVIFQWWNPFFAPAFICIAKYLKRKGIKVYCTSHNTLPHEKIPFDRFLARRFFRFVDYFITHSVQDTNQILLLKPEAIVKKTVMPIFNGFGTTVDSKEEALKKLNIDRNKRVLLFFGFVRKYKGLMTLIDAMPEVIENHENTMLLVVGDFYSDKDDYIERIEELNIKENIIIVDDYIPDRTVGDYFIASDVVVLPYLSATQSAIVQIANSFVKPVIATNVGGLPEVIQHKKTGLIVEPADPHLLASAIKEYYNENYRDIFEKNIKDDLEKYSWDKMVELINSIDNESN